MRTLPLSLAAAAASLATLLVASPAAALNARAEATAKDAIKKAAAEYKTQKVDAAIARLADALNGCGDDGCSNPTKAALLRDLGSARMKQEGGRAMAGEALVAAIETDPKVQINPAYDSPELRAEWTAAKDEASMAKATQPSGDFEHTPAIEQAENTPLPIYVTYAGAAHFKKVMVRYKAAGDTEQKELELKKRGPGWGGLIPCADVKRGVLRYWIEGVDQNNSVESATGNPEQPFFVPIHVAIANDPPHLPGARPPKSCTECPDRTPTCDGEPAPSSSSAGEGEEGKTGDEEEGEEGEKKEEKPAERYRRWWIGFGGSIDIADAPATNDVCKLTSAAVPANDAGWYCTNPDGSDFPTRHDPAQNDSLAPGKAGKIDGGILASNPRVFVSLDYAFSSHFLLGARLGYVLNTYPGQAATKDGHAFGTPIHLEARGTFLIGEDPLASTGLRPYVFLATGISEFDYHFDVKVAQAGIPGTEQVQAWITGGPFFIAAGGGARYALSPRFAVMGGLRLTDALGGVRGFHSVAPELLLQYGF